MQRCGRSVFRFPSSAVQAPPVCGRAVLREARGTTRKQNTIINSSRICVLFSMRLSGRTMSVPDTHRIAICATTKPALDALAELVGASGWEALRVRWRDAAALEAATLAADAYLVQGGVDRACQQLATSLGARPAGRPLVVLGADPMRAASPSLWLPEPPPPGILIRLVADLIEASAPPAAAPWRR